jgi:acetyl esterase
MGITSYQMWTSIANCRIRRQSSSLNLLRTSQSANSASSFSRSIDSSFDSAIALESVSHLHFVCTIGSEIRADPRRLAVGGDSTGGFLAAGVAQKAANIGLPLGLQVLLYPSLDAIMSRPSWAEFGGGDYVLSHSDMLAWYDAYLPSKINREDPSVSPFFATDLSGLAPAFIVTTDHDPLRDEGNEYASRLTAANIAVDHTCWPGMIHGFASVAGVVDAGGTLVYRVGAALRNAFE